MSSQPLHKQIVNPARRRPWRVSPRRKKVPSAKLGRWRWLALPVLAFVALALLSLAPHPLVQRIHYPLNYQALLLSEARRTGLPVTLVAALIREESRFSAQATSPVGARGLMQLMPETAQWVDEHLEGNPARNLDLSKPEINLRLGTTYLEYLSQRFQGQEISFLAAYNAGPSCALQWQAEARAGQLQLDDIKYPETRAYVEAVLESERMYRELYPELRLSVAGP